MFYYLKCSSIFRFALVATNEGMAQDIQYGDRSCEIAEEVETNETLPLKECQDFNSTLSCCQPIGDR